MQRFCFWFCIALLPLYVHGEDVQSERVQGEGAARDERRFIACPVYRDTDAGPKSGCWLATERASGELFDVSAALTKPQLGKAMLVEGVVSGEGRDYCGGEVLNPVRVSVLPESCAKHIIPGEGYPSRVFAPPGETMQPLTVPRLLPEGPFADKTFTILFNFQSSFLNYQYSEVILEKAALYIKAGNAKQVRVIGFSATEDYVVSGRTLREADKLGRARAEMVALALDRLGVAPDILRVSSQGRPAVVPHYAGGLAEETKRRVEIHVSF